MSLYLGIDTSCYTTSAALFEAETGKMKSRRKLLEVKAGGQGLRQSEMVYQHVRNLPGLFKALFEEEAGSDIRAVGASVRPRDAEGSHMPCFEAGASAARSVSACMGLPLFEFSHQAGHIASALFSIDRLDLLKQEFLAFHVSGGTTECLLCTPGSPAPQIELLSGSLDLKAGQAVDRVGVMLGLGFPAGPALEKLARQSGREFHPKPTMKGADCCLSGLENLCRHMMDSGEPPCDVAAFCLSYIRATLESMLLIQMKNHPGLPVIFAGGVMSNGIIREYLKAKYGVLFSKPEFSSDNASGIAILTKIKDERV